MAAFLDLCRFRASAGGTSDFVYSSAVGGCQSPSAAGVVNARNYKWIAISDDLTQFEIFEGAYNTSTGTAPRTTVLYNSSGTGTATGQSGAGSKINFTAAPQVACIGVKEDLISIEEANGFTTTQQAQARKNVAAIGIIKVQKFTTSGTYTPSANLAFAILEGVGGGGSGGGVGGSSGAYLAGGGGGAGSYSRVYADAGTIGASQTVAIGAGGVGTAGGTGTAGSATSVGTLLVANGGDHGTASTSGQIGVGGAGGSAGTGDIAFRGGAGEGGFFNNTGTNVQSPSGKGGDSIFGGGGLGVSSGAGVAGLANSGGGGSGGYVAVSATNIAGGNGGSGVVIVTEFCFA